LHTIQDIMYARNYKICQHIPSKVLLILVSGSLESLSSSTTSVRDSNAGSIRENFVMWPGYHAGGGGSSGNGICGGIADLIRES
jgi:hypothetical protein